MVQEQFTAMSSNRSAEGGLKDLPDVADFIDLVNSLHRSPKPRLRQLFVPDEKIFITRAPGRLDVMGGIADYSGSLVLELPIKEATFVALQRNRERSLITTSLCEDSGEELIFEMPLDDFNGRGGPITFAEAQAYFRRDPKQHWAAYVAGVFLVLMREYGVNFSDGVRMLISSQVPTGKGVSSSAALEVAAMQAAAAAFDLEINGRDLARLCQVVENLVVGAPCGVMDQMTSACGQANRLLSILCQPAELQGTITIPSEISFWGIDSGVRHAVTGADYASVRIGAFMGYRIIADLAHLRVSNVSTERVLIDDPRWKGYLSNVSPSEFDREFAARLPEKIDGSEFLERYQGTTDAVTQVSAGQTYAVRVPTQHAIHEHHRVRIFAELLSELNDRRLELLGELMYQSHASYSACALGVAATDRLVELVREAGPARGLYGAKITGGGSGGTVAVLGLCTAGAAIEEIASSYAREMGHQPYLFAGSSPGSDSFGCIKLNGVR